MGDFIFKLQVLFKHWYASAIISQLIVLLLYHKSKITRREKESKKSSNANVLEYIKVIRFFCVYVGAAFAHRNVFCFLLLVCKMHWTLFEHIIWNFSSICFLPKNINYQAFFPQRKALFTSDQRCRQQEVQAPQKLSAPRQLFSIVHLWVYIIDLSLIGYF